MLRLHSLQATRRRLLDRYRALVTHSEHMRQEYIKHGYPADRIFNFTYYVGRGRSEPLVAIQGTRAGANGQRTTPTWKGASGDGEHRLLFLGRMDRLKGGGTLLSALRRVKTAFPGPLRVTFAGDGPERRAWEREARQVSAAHRDLVIEFVGWVGAERRRELLGACDLLVLPSLWPEPFGRVGLEAGLQGVPVVAFAVGGIPEWLRDGVNGYLAPGDPPTAGGLAEAILRALRDSRTEMREGARRIADEFSIENHLAHLELVFAKVLGDDWRAGIHEDDPGRSSPSAVTLAHSPDPDVASR
jgi:glycosyltransferase involved in cell wall biosynthesis